MFRHSHLFVVVILIFTLVGMAADKPKITVAADQFPTGQDTPEGVATDLARVFIHHDVKSYQAICVRSHGANELRGRYTEFLKGAADYMRKQAVAAEKSPDDPKRILKVFAARHLTRNGPASYGYAAFDFQDVMFVDVRVLLNDDTEFVNRTLVIKDRDGRWYVHPTPNISPLLSAGLYDESASSIVFSQVYKLSK